MRSRALAVVLVVLGLLLAVGWSVLIVPALFMAESGAGLDILERLLVAAPMAIASGLLVTGGARGLRPRHDSTAVHGVGLRAVFVGGVMLGAIAGMAALGFLLA